MIRRGDHQTDYFVMPNAAANDDRLSFEARGVHAFLLSKPADWMVNPKALAAHGKVGRDKIYRILDELVAAGYARREQGRDQQGRRTAMEYTIYDTPITADLFSPRPENQEAVAPSPENTEADEPRPENPDAVPPLPGLPDTAQPHTGQPYPANPPLQSKERNKVQRRTKEPPGFEDFWEAYGGDAVPNMSKKRAALEWARVVHLVEPHRLVGAAAAYRAWLAAPAQKGHPITHAAKWLEEHRWESFLPRAAAPPAEPIIAMEIECPRWREACLRLAAAIGADSFNSWIGRGKLTSLAPLTFVAESRFIETHVRQNFQERLSKEMGQRLIVSHDHQVERVAL